MSTFRTLFRSAALATLGCGLIATVATAQDEEEDCFSPSPEYQGIHAVPPVTLQIYPSVNGDTVLNDAEHPPGAGRQVVVGYWEFDADRAEDVNPCVGEPTMKIAYPVDFGPKCFAWKHWVKTSSEDGTAGVELHENSAQNFACTPEGDLTLDQWVDTMVCENPNRAAKTKTAHRTACCMDTPAPPGGTTAIYSQILSGCGKTPPEATSG